MATAYANLFMGKLETINHAPTWKQFIDDIFIIIYYGLEQQRTLKGLCYQLTKYTPQSNSRMKLAN